MGFLTKIINKVFYVLFLLLLLSGCKEAVAPDFNNTNDPESVLFYGQSPSDLKTTVLSQNVIRLDWQDNSNYEKGYIIERSANNEDHFVEIGQVGQNISFFIDSGAVGNNRNIYFYRVVMKNIVTNNTTEINSNIYSTKNKIADNVGAFRLSPNNEYIAITRNSKLIVMNISDGKILLEFTFNEYNNFAISDKYIAISDNETYPYSIVKIWKISDGTMFASFQTSYLVRNMAFNNKSNILVTNDDALSIWDIESFSFPKKIKKITIPSYPSIGFSYDDKYLIGAANQEFVVYSTTTWEPVFTYQKYGYDYVGVAPRYVNHDIILYGGNPLIFYDLVQQKIISTIKDSLNFNAINQPSMTNINKTGIILSVIHGSAYSDVIDIWLLNNNYELLKKLKTINLGDYSKEDVFTNKNDFIVRTYYGGNLYLWKYY